MPSRSGCGGLGSRGVTAHDGDVSGFRGNFPHILVHHWVFKCNDIWCAKDCGKNVDARLKGVSDMLNGCTRHPLLMSKLVGDFAKVCNSVATLVTRVDTVAMKAVSYKSGNVEISN